MKHVILINGLKRSGKDTFATILKASLEKRGFSVDMMSFASTLKQLVLDQFEISDEELDFLKNKEVLLTYNFKGEERQTSFRRILQKTGDAIKSFTKCPNIFGNITFEAVCESSCDIVIIPDFRFMAEYESALAFQYDDFYEEESFKLLTVNIANSSISYPADLHASETELRDHEFVFDFLVDNDGKTLDLLKEQAEALTSKIETVWHV